MLVNFHMGARYLRSASKQSLKNCQTSKEHLQEEKYISLVFLLLCAKIYCHAEW